MAYWRKRRKKVRRRVRAVEEIEADINAIKEEYKKCLP